MDTKFFKPPGDESLLSKWVGDAKEEWEEHYNHLKSTYKSWEDWFQEKLFLGINKLFDKIETREKLEEWKTTRTLNLTIANNGNPQCNLLIWVIIFEFEFYTIGSDFKVLSLTP